MSSDNKKINILIWYWGRKGGGAKHSLELSKALSIRNDVNLHISICEECELYDELMKLNHRSSFNISIFPTKIKLFINTLKLPLIKKRFGNYIKQNNIDVVLCPMVHYWNGYVCSEISRNNAKYIFTVNDATNHPGEENAFYESMLKKQLEKCDIVLTLSNYVRNIVLQKYAIQSEKCWMVPLGTFNYNENFQKHMRAKNQKIRLLFFGRIEKYKGLNICIEAYKILQKKSKDVELFIVGNGDFSEYEKSSNGVKGITKQIRWIGEEEIAEIFNNSDILLNTYLEASQSGVIAIAINMGIPTVVTPVGGLTEQIIDHETGIIAKEITPQSVADAIELLIDDNKLYENISMNCVELSKNKMSWNARANEIVALICNEWGYNGEN